MNTIANWLSQHKISTHTIAVIGAGVIAAYQLNPDFHNLVTALWAKVPGWAATLIATGAWIYAWYRNGQKAPASAGLNSLLGHTLALTLAAGLVLAGIGCSHYQIHPGAIPIGTDQGAFDSKTADFLADEKAFLDAADTHSADYNEYVASVLSAAHTQYQLTKTAYLTWRGVQNAQNLANVQSNVSKLQTAVENFTAAKNAAPAPSPSPAPSPTQ